MMQVGLPTRNIVYVQRIVDNLPRWPGSIKFNSLAVVR